MNRFAVFIDAGHLITEGSKLCLGLYERIDTQCDEAGLIDEIVGIAKAEATGQELLRVYWYDGAPLGGPTQKHKEMDRLPDVKVRLGRVSMGRQKGVDSRIVRDMMTLARERAISSAFLVAGDEDLREGVVDAQESGVRVTLIGIEPADARYNQSRHLVSEADRCIILNRDALSPYFERRTDRISVSVPLGTAEGDVPGLIGQLFGEEWLTRCTPDDLSDLLSSRPVIPHHIDGDLILAAADHIDIDGKQALRRTIRAEFWAVIETAADDASGAK